MKTNKKESVGAIWVKEKIKYTKKGKKLLIKFLSIKINNEFYVAFSSGKKSDKNSNYPDLIIYKSKRNSNNNNESIHEENDKIYNYEEIVNDNDDDIEYEDNF